MQDRILDTIGKNLKTLRKENDLSQEELAQRTKLHRTFISGIEKGNRNISILSLYKIAEALNIEIVYFFKSQGGKDVTRRD